MNSYDTFINAYKELEKECRENNIEVKDLEDKLPEDESNKLRMCRYFRNFIQHVKGYETFLNITPGMQSFLNKTLNDYINKDDLVSSHIIKIANISCTLKDKVCDVLEKVSKNKYEYVVVLDKDEVLGILSVYQLLKENNKTAKIKDLAKPSKKYNVVQAETKLANIEANDVTICFKNNKPIGVVKVN